MTGQDLIAEMYKLAERMDESIDSMRENGVAAATADRDYRKKKAVRMAGLKADGWPATTTETMANGDDAVAEERYKRDYHDALRDAEKELLQTLKRRFDLARSIYEREYGRG